MNKRFWNGFESYFGYKLPEEIRRIICVSGFDNPISILVLKASDIAEIEKCVNGNKSIFENSNIYSSSEQFVLKPGHRALILNLPDKFKEYYDFLKQEDEKKGEKSVANETRNERESELTHELIEKLESYLYSLNYAVKIDRDSVTYFESDNKDHNISCHVKCPFCKKKLLVNYGTYWVLGNIERHFRDDIKKQTQQSENHFESIVDEFPHELVDESQDASSPTMSLESS